MKPCHFLSAFFVILFSIPLTAQNQLEQSDIEALYKTQQLLNSTTERNQAISNSKEAQKNHEAIKSLTHNNPNQMNDIYSLSSDIFSSLVQKTNGDPNQLQKLIEEAQKNPEAFAQKFTQEQKSKLRRISSQIKSSQSVNP